MPSNEQQEHRCTQLHTPYFFDDSSSPYEVWLMQQAMHLRVCVCVLGDNSNRDLDKSTRAKKGSPGNSIGLGAMQAQKQVAPCADIPGL